MKIFAETERLILRELIASDDQGMFELDSDPDVHLYLGNKPVISIEQCREVIKFIQSQYRDFGIGRWAVIEKSSENFIGWCGLKYMTAETNQHINFYDIGYRFIKSAWGKGYATESALAVLNYGFETLKLKEIYGMADAGNAGSDKVLRKIGLTYIEQFDYDGTLHNWYKIDRERYLAKLP